ncbi:hypothetical protein RQP46_006651 [Phenoliferia psychrophenolica]
MPWINLPEHSMQIFYLVNAQMPLDSHLSITPPESQPLDPSKPTIVFLHSSFSCTSEFSAQVQDSMEVFLQLGLRIAAQHRQLETAHSIVEKWLPAALTNKDGMGDRTGKIDDQQVEELKAYYFGDMGREEERRKLFGKAFQRRYGTGRSSDDLIVMGRYLRRNPIPPAVLATLTVPILILQGGLDVISSPEEAGFEWQHSFPLAKGGADLHVITGAPHMLCYTDSSIAK